MSTTVTMHKDPIVPSVEAIESMQRNVDYWGERCCKAEAENERLRAQCAAYESALDRIAGGDGYYPELAMAKLRAIRAMKE